MKLSITLSAVLVAGFMAASTRHADAVVYCQYVDYPTGTRVMKSSGKTYTNLIQTHRTA